MLSRPASGQWLMARVASLLMDYYAADVPSAIISMAAADWADELGEFPQWAVDMAVRWWKGAENPDRRKKPLPGDIAVRAKFEMGAIAVANLAVRRFDEGKLPPAKPGKASAGSPEDRQRAAAEILAAAGFRPKSFNGTAE